MDLKPGPEALRAVPGGEPPAIRQPAAQQRYARWLEWGTRVGLVAMLLAFAAYLADLLPPQVGHARLAEAWSLPLAEYLAATGMPTGWGWLADLGHGDVASLAGIALLASCSIPALLALVPLYRRDGDRAFVALVVAQVAVLVLAASGWLAVGH